jgi:hypothetical protein
MKFSYGDVECYIKTHCPDDFTSTGDGYKKDAKDAVKDGIELKIIEARTGDGQLVNSREFKKVAVKKPHLYTGSSPLKTLRSELHSRRVEN